MPAIVDISHNSKGTIAKNIAICCQLIKGTPNTHLEGPKSILQHTKQTPANAQNSREAATHYVYSKGNNHEGKLSPKNKCGQYERATSEKLFGVSLAYFQSLEGSQKAG